MARVKRRALSTVASAVGIEEALLFKWSLSPPSAEAIRTCSDQLRLRRTSTAVEQCTGAGVGTAASAAQSLPFSTSTTISERDLSILCRCKRLWAAGVICAYVDGSYSIGQLASLYNVPSKFSRHIMYSCERYMTYINVLYRYSTSGGHRGSDAGGDDDGLEGAALLRRDRMGQCMPTPLAPYSPTPHTS
jgi:hypothetical protein